MSDFKPGLEGVVVAETELSDVDGEGGRLVVRGYAVDELCGTYAFEDVWLLLWTGVLPTEAERRELQRELAMGRAAAFAQLAALARKQRE